MKSTPPILPAVARREKANKKSLPQSQNVKKIAKTFRLPTHLVRHFISIGIITDCGDDPMDIAVLSAICALNRDRRYCRYVMSKFTTSELSELIIQKGMDNLDVLIHNIMIKTPGLSKATILTTLLHTHGIPSSKAIEEKIVVLQRRIRNAKYQEKKKIQDTYGSEEDVRKEEEWMEYLAKTPRKPSLKNDDFLGSEHTAYEHACLKWQRSEPK